MESRRGLDFDHWKHLFIFLFFCIWFTVKGNKVHAISLKKRFQMVISKHSFFRVNDNTTSLLRPSGRFMESIILGSLRLHQYGITGKLQDWFRSYLQGRK